MAELVVGPVWLLRSATVPGCLSHRHHAHASNESSLRAGMETMLGHRALLPMTQDAQVLLCK